MAAQLLNVPVVTIWTRLSSGQILLATLVNPMMNSARNSLALRESGVICPVEITTNAKYKIRADQGLQ